MDRFPSSCAFASPVALRGRFFSFPSHPNLASPFLRHAFPACRRRPRPSSNRRLLESASRDVAVERVLQDTVIQVHSDLPCDKTKTVPVAIKTESLGGRRRRISGAIDIQSSVPRVWHVLTAYHYIDKYMPNIVKCDVRELNGVLFLDQIGIISRKLMLRTRMLLRVSEDLLKRSLTFTRVEGRDFSEFVGVFSVLEMEDHVRLEYELDAIPFPLFPMYLVERKVVKEVPKMLAAVREEALAGKVVPFTNSPVDQKVDI